jgi:anti-anti-sigma regulatory factor
LDVEPLQAALLRLSSRRPPCVIFDLSKLESISSLAMGMLVASRRAAIRAGGRVCLAATLQSEVREALDSAQLMSLFEAAGDEKPCIAPAFSDEGKPHLNRDDAQCTAGVTWAQLVELEPRLETLLWQARGAGAGCHSCDDVNRAFRTLRDELAALIGFNGQHRQHSILGGPVAYQIAYSKLHDAVAGLLSGRSSYNEE